MTRPQVPEGHRARPVPDKSAYAGHSRSRRTTKARQVWQCECGQKFDGFFGVTVHWTEVLYARQREQGGG